MNPQNQVLLGAACLRQPRGFDTAGHSLRRAAVTFISVGAVLLAAAVCGHAAVQAWVQRYDAANYADGANALVLDSSGNILVTGGSVTNGGWYDYLTIKYSSAGEPLWTNRYSRGEATALAVDASGNVFVTGYVSTGGTNADFVTLKYSSAGVPLWTNRYNGPDNSEDLARAIAVDGSGNVYATGSSWANAGSFDYVTLKYSSAGVPLWTNRYNGPANDWDVPQAIALDNSGNVCVAGYSTGVGTGSDYAAIAYTSAGVPLWTNRYNGSANAGDVAQAVAFDSTGDVYVSGYSTGAGSDRDFATLKYSAAGAPLWTNRYNGPGNGVDEAAALALDGSGNVHVTGASAGTATGSDYATIKYSSLGVPLWTNRYNGPGDPADFASAVALDAVGDVFVTGTSGGDYATLAYTAAGASLWTNRYNGPGNLADGAAAIAVDASGSVCVTGLSTGIGTGYDFATVKYVNVPVINSTLLAGTNLVFSGTGGSPTAYYHVLTSTNMAEAMTNWARLATNSFGLDGSFAVTNAVDPARPQQYFRLSLP